MSSFEAATASKFRKQTTEYGDSGHSMVKYDLIGKIAENTQLTRRTVAIS